MKKKTTAKKRQAVKPAKKKEVKKKKSSVTTNKSSKRTVVVKNSNDKEKGANIDKVVIFPKKVPFWARLKIGGKHPSLIIDREMIVDRRNKKLVPGFVYRESTHSKDLGEEEIKPNPDKSDDSPMYLKGPEKKPQRLFKPMNKKLRMPKDLRERYQKNNK